VKPQEGTLSAPFPYFGGKSRGAAQVWQSFGEVKNYVEPFAGSLAVLLAAPEGQRTETVNDLDGFIANFWRAMVHDPQATAHYADWPVNEVDLFARHSWLVRQRVGLTDRLHDDPGYFDAKIAGWWVWGACNWIGDGWCSGKGPWVHDGEKIIDARKQSDAEKGQGITRRLPHLSRGQGINRQLPHLGDAGQGINRKLPHLSQGQGINRKLPHLSQGKGINRQLPHLGDVGRGINRSIPSETADRREFIFKWFGELHQRLRDVRVTCGEWQRVLGPSPTTMLGQTAVFLDPPYTNGDMDYGAGGMGQGIADSVRQWCIENGDNEKLRIVLCGHAEEHDELLAHGWSIKRWKARGYGKTDEAKANAASETLWCSPHCIAEVAIQASIFDQAEASA